ncbi:putative capsid protein [Spinybacked orbweaver circular virus 2]|nr:putative capsid protein [Spinybacked orbweaver circular virus 2]
MAYLRARYTNRRFSRRGLRQVQRRRRLIRRRRPRKSNLSCKFTTNLVLKQTTGIQYAHIAPALEDFAETTNLITNFEYYKIRKVRITVTPRNNVAYQGQSVPDYVIAPFHHPVDDKSISVDSLLTLDRHKKYRGTQRGHMTFKPAVIGLASTSLDDSSGTYATMRWSPKILITNNTTPQQVKHFCGLLAFAPQGSNAQEYEITLDAYCTFYNQKINKLL